VPIGPRLSQLLAATGGKARVFEGTGGIALIDSFQRGIVGTMPGADLIDGIVALWRAPEGPAISKRPTASGCRWPPWSRCNTASMRFWPSRNICSCDKAYLPTRSCAGPWAITSTRRLARKSRRLFELLMAAVCCY